MAKRKITVTVDEELVEMVHQLGGDKLSSVVNSALAEHVQRLSRLASLRQILDQWDAEAGPVSPKAMADAAAAFDQFDDDLTISRR